MARIRSIKPELLEDEKVARLPHLEWRLFVSCLLLCDDYGNFRAAPARVHGAVLWAHPREGLAKALERLAADALVLFYAVADQLYGHVAGWERHQKVDHPGKPLCPALTADSRLSREGLAKILDPLAPDQDQDPDQEEDHDPDLSLPSRSTPDQTRAESESRASKPLTGFLLQQLFGRVRSEVVGGMPWQSVNDAGGKASTMAELVNADPGARADVEPTIRMLFHDAKAGRGDRAKDVRDNPSFAFGAWCSKWTELRERLHRKAPRTADDTAVASTDAKAAEYKRMREAMG